MDGRTGPQPLEALQEAIGTPQEAIETTPPKQPDPAAMFDIFHFSLAERCKETGALEDLQKLIYSLQEALKATPPDHPYRAMRLYNLGISLGKRYERTGELDDADEAIDNFEKAVKGTPRDHPQRAICLDCLSNWLSKRYGRTGSLEDLDAAIYNGEEAINATPHDHRCRARRLANLGNWLGYRYQRTRKLDDLEKAICMVREAVKGMPPDHPSLPLCLSNLGNLLGNRYGRTGSLEDLEEAICTVQEAVNKTPPGHPHRPICLHNLGNKLGKRYEKTEALEDLEEAIHSCEEAVKATLPDHPLRAILLENLGSWLEKRYRRTGALENVEDFIHNCKDAVKALPPDHPDRARWLCNLGIELGKKYERTGAVDDLEEAIHNCEEAVKGTPPDHSGRAKCLKSLGSLLGQRYCRTGAPEDLEEAIHNCEEAVGASPPDHPNRAMCLDLLGSLLDYRYDTTAELEDLEEAIRNLQEAVRITPSDNVDRAGRFNNLGVVLRDRYDRTGKLEDLEEAIYSCEEATKAMPPGHPNQAMWLNNLGNGLATRYGIGMRYGTTRALDDLEEAIRILREAVKITPHEHSDRAARLTNLGVLLTHRYERTQVLEDLEEAIYNCKESVKATPHDHPNLAAASSALGISLHSKYKRTRLPEDFESAVASFNTAACMENALPMQRIRSVCNLGFLLADNARWLEASKAFESAVNMLPRISPSLLSRADQQYVLGELSGTSSFAASLALQADRPVSDALKFLEASRCIIAGLAINSRSDVSDLRASHPTICKEYERCREEVTRYRTGEEFNTNDKLYGRRAASRKNSLEDLAAVETKIRQIPGFKQFQLPPEPTDLMRLAESGPIVAFNVSTIRSDAIIVTSTRIWVIKLPDLSYDRLVAKAKSIATAGTSSRRNAKVRVSKSRKHSPKEQVRKDLLWLWKVAVLPVLNELGLQPLQRVWWVTGGVMGLVPIHAAGDHSEGSLENTFSRVVSSYTSTFKSLRYAREKVKAESSEYRMLLVDMPETPEHEILNTEHEVNVIRNEFGELVILLKHPTKAEVMDKLGGCSFAHFACHGTSNPEDPAEGGLLLVGEGKPTLLSIRELDKVNLQHAELAYLSACSTAELPTGKLVDEAIHLSNSFQIIGFRHIIGTMWGADDHAAGEVAGIFYKALLSNSKGDRGGELRVARALYDAVAQFRSRPNIREDVLKWGPFIHVGV